MTGADPVILLPPSETKADGTMDQRLDLDALRFSALSATRRRVADALVRLSSGKQATALAALGITARQSHELERNARLHSARTGPARQVYTGVLFDHVGFGTLSAAALSRADSLCLVQSALYGLVGLGENIAPYRLSADSRLPRIASLPSLWSPLCSPLLAAMPGMVVDLRSGSYAAMGHLPRDGWHVVPRVMQVMPSGPPKVVSHSNKATKGRLLRTILTSRGVVRTPDQLASAAAAHGDVTLVEDRGVWRLDLVVTVL